MLPGHAALAGRERTTVVEDRQLCDTAIHVTAAEVQQAAGRLACLAFRDRAFEDVALLDANYLRVPDAEVVLRSRLNPATPEP